MNTQYTEPDLLMDCLRYGERIPEFLMGAELNQMPSAVQLTDNPRLAYCYAAYVIKGSWSPGEAAIAQDPHWAYRYVVNVIRGPWPPGEAAIARSAEWAHLYTLWYKHPVDQ